MDIDHILINMGVICGRADHQHGRRGIQDDILNTVNHRQQFSLWKSPWVIGRKAPKPHGLRTAVTPVVSVPK